MPRSFSQIKPCCAGWYWSKSRVYRVCCVCWSYVCLRLSTVLVQPQLTISKLGPEVKTNIMNDHNQRSDTNRLKIVRNPIFTGINNVLFLNCDYSDHNCVR
jgi:hypothetical protein